MTINGGVILAENMFTDEQLEILRNGFQAHDFTQSVSLSPEYDDMSPEQNKAFVALKKRVIDYMQSNLPELGISRPPKNFAGDHPVNILMNADATFIANEAVNILSDEQRTLEAVNYFFDMFGELVDKAILIYCSRRQKTPDELTDEDEQYIMDYFLSL